MNKFKEYFFPILTILVLLIDLFSMFNIYKSYEYSLTLKNIDLLKKNLSEKDVIIASQKNEIAKLKKALENKALKTLQEL